MSQKYSKSDTLYRQIRDDILTLNLSPDSPLRLPALAERYDVGITPIRECLNRLSIEKLVTIEHNKGFRVSGISLKDLLDLENSRSAIEGTLFQRSVERGDDFWEAQVIGAFHQLSITPAMSISGSQSDIDLWNKRHTAFHHALISAADAPWLQHFHHQLTDQLGRYQLFIQIGLRDLFASHPNNAPKIANVYAQAMAVEPHTELYEAVLKRNKEQARYVFEQHINLSISAFQDLNKHIPASSNVAMKLQTERQEARS